MPFRPFGTTRVLKVRFWPFLDNFGPFWALLGQNLGQPPHRHTPNCAKTSARMSCNSFHAIPTVWDHQNAQSQILAILCHFWPFLDHFGPFWGLLDQNWGDPRTPNWVKTSTRMSCNLFHAVPTVLDHQSAPARALKPTSIIGHKKGHFQIFGLPEEVERGEIFEKSF